MVIPFLRSDEPPGVASGRAANVRGSLVLDGRREVLRRRLEDRVALEAHRDVELLRAADLALGEADRLVEGAGLAELGVARAQQLLALLDREQHRAGAGRLGVHARRDLDLAL